MKLLASLRPETRLGRPVALTSVLALLIATIPGPALASAARPIERFAASLEERPDGHAGPMPRSRLLTAAYMAKAQGRAGENPYLAGQAKWDVVYKGVNLMTGNYSASGTDLTFEGGYGIPVNVTRSYSANNPDEGPLGKGWTLSVDVRSTAGGLLKSGRAPVRAVPVGFKARPSAQADPNAELATGARAQPVEAVIATDAGGTEETVQVDADGVLTTPPWDKNTNETDYDFETRPDGSILRKTKRNKTLTPDGTTYVYERLGTYPNDSRPWNDPGAPGEHSDVLKIVSATDRQGNVTDYHYGTSEVSFQKANGAVTEKRLEWIHMPNGHEIHFAWSGNRIVSASDGVRTVTYGYTNGLLTSVQTPQGTLSGNRTTTYGYGGSGSASDWQGPVAGGLLTSVTDPRGLAVQIYYQTQDVYSGPMAAYAGTGVVVQTIRWPNGAWTAFAYGHTYRTSTGFTGVNGHAVDHTAADWNGPQWGEYSGNGRFQWVNAALLGDVGNGSGPNLFKSLGSEWYAKTLGNDWLQYDTMSQNLVYETHYTFTPWRAVSQGYDSWDLARARGLLPTDGPWTESRLSHADVETAYNFMGNPLKKTMREYPIGASSPSRTASVEYAYWGADKYWQQRSVRDAGETLGDNDRFSVTDYYPNTAPLGSRGQTARVWDARNGGVTWTDGANNLWKYNVAGTADKYGARFEYDSKGRATDVWKLRAAPTSGSYTYVQTHTTYGADGAPSWGQANAVVEDYGGINRTTQTTEYDSMGRAVRVQDASGQTFHTTYDLDGVVQSVEKANGSGWTPMVSYTYGAAAGTLTNGQVLSVKDELSSVVQDFGYVPRGAGAQPDPGYGQIAGVIESGGPNPQYQTSYTYNDAGDRRTATYTTPNGATRWLYDDYVSLGSPDSPSRAFQTLVRLDSGNGYRSKEEFHYVYDTRGHLMEAAFAQTPDANQTPPTGGASWYGGGMTYSGASSATKKAGSRARAHYEYDAGGRLTLVAHYWDVLSGSSYTPTKILANECDYELADLSRGLKTSSRFYKGTGIGANSVWNNPRIETYGYDDKNDQLTGANYGDAGADAVQSWSYDAAGNRASDSSQPGAWTYDALNRMLTSPQGSYEHDVLGNRLVGPDVRDGYGWDALGRMTSLGKTGFQAQYAYRADGMRVRKSTHRGSYVNQVTTTRHDGQMPFEIVESSESGSSATIDAVERHALGARGTDLIERQVGADAAQTRFPLYDAHGNSVATLGRAGTNSWTLGDERSYDAWGRVRLGGQTGAPSARYCASLGHVQDDESGLVYMRARYYEPGTGRFVSEDPARHGSNWYGYCSNNPVNRTDDSGKWDHSDDQMMLSIFGSAALGHLVSNPAFYSALASILARKTLEAAAAAAFRFGTALFMSGEVEVTEGATLMREGEAIEPMPISASGGVMMLGGAAKIEMGNAMMQLGLYLMLKSMEAL